MTRTWDDQQVHDLLGVVLSNLQLSGAQETGAIPLAKVAESCGFAPSTLLRDCRADRFEHLAYGGNRSMTADQVGKFMAKVTRGGDYEVLRETPRDEMAEARALSLRNANRKTSRRGR